MTNLLDRRERRLVRREYYLRVFATALVLLGLIAGAGAVTLLPSFFALRVSVDELQQRSVEVATSLAKNDTDGTSAQLAVVREKMRILTEASGPSLHTILAALQEHYRKGISINSLSYSPSTNGAELHIGGVASTREALTSFHKQLETARGFSDVLLPVGNLARDRDIDFTITARYTP